MIIGVIKNTIMITSFVLVIMLVIEYINVQSKGNWLIKIEKHRWLQYIVTGTMGIIPGCVGTFAVVSMYIHNLVSFGALITALIAGFGDEAFIMFALMPGTTLKLTAIIFIIGIVGGVLTDYFMKGKNIVPHIKKHFELHTDESDHFIFNLKSTWSNMINMSFPRGALLGGILLVILGIVTNEFSEGPGHKSWDWEQISFLAVMICGLFILLTVSEHFLEKHLWGHVVKKHLLKILLWTFGTLLFLAFFKTQIHLDAWIKSNQFIILLMAVVIGIIPESGPHLIFVSLFLNGAIPFSTLLASSIVQDGHGSLPLLAESKKSFLLAKTINILMGLVVGLTGLYLFK
jgi:hypothetical protein